ncbi:MAG: hypothetical protein L6254_00720 [Candidatus Omnitrophica bacterium]|nr:hypothetical protein [Candidatus Omnitrophota bacterium]
MNIIYKGPPTIEKYELALFIFLIKIGENKKGKKTKIEAIKEPLINFRSLGTFSISRTVSPKFRKAGAVKIAAI